MTETMDILRRRHAAIVKRQRARAVAQAEAVTVEPLVYKDNPVGYIHDKLKQKLWPKQEAICNALLKPPYKVWGKASHGVGKSFIAACLINWFFDTFPQSLCITTAPTYQAVTDQLWRECRRLRARVGLGCMVGTQAPELWKGVDWWAKGFTTDRGEAFHGRHQKHMLFVVDEAPGVAPWVFESIKSMFDPSGNHYWLCIGNPTDTATQMYSEEFAESITGAPAWSVVSMNSFEHPNVTAKRGEPLPFPGAVTVEQVETWIADWCTPITAEEAVETDLQWPPETTCPCCGGRGEVDG